MHPISQIAVGMALARPLLLAGQELASQLRDHMSDLVLRLKRRAAMRRTMRALQALDAQSLRDLGLHECEASSAGAEFAGLGERQRLRIAPVPRHLRGQG